MPAKDKIGPEGEDSGTGRGKGPCSDKKEDKDKPSTGLRRDKVIVDEVGLGGGGKPRRLRQQDRNPLSWLERAR